MRGQASQGVVALPGSSYSRRFTGLLLSQSLGLTLLSCGSPGLLGGTA